MFDTQVEQTRIDELNRCRDRAWLSIEDEKRFGITNLANFGKPDGKIAEIDPEAVDPPFGGMIHIGQKVFLPGDQLIGLTTKLFYNLSGNVSYLAVRTARLFGRHKMVPIASISDVTSLRVMLSMNRDQFMELPGYPTDFSIAEEVDRALWKDVVLRDTDYHEIDVQVQNAMITLNGHVTTSMNQWRAETAVKNIPGILGMKSYIIPDDKLTLIVAEALGQIEQGEDCKFFSRVENGLAVLLGEVNSTALRDQAEQSVAEIPWVRGVINEIRVSGTVVDSGDQRFLQPFIGNELIFKDTLSVTIRKVIINPHNRRVVGVVVLGRFPDPLRQGSDTEYPGENDPERLVVLPVRLILSLTRSDGFIRISSDEVTEYQDYDPACYVTPDKDWLPPYPYCTDDVLFLTE